MTTTISKNLLSDIPVSKAGDTMIGDLTVSHGNSPNVITKPATIGGTPGFAIQDTTSVKRGDMYVTESSGVLTIANYDAGGVLNTKIDLSSAGVVMDGGDVTIEHAGHTDLNVKATTTGNLARITLANSGNNVGCQFTAGTGQIELHRTNAIGSSTGRVFSVNGTQLTFDANPRTLVAQEDNIAALTRKDYVDDNFVDLTTAQTVAGNKSLTGSTLKVGGTAVSTYALSIQSAATDTWMEILNSGGTNQGAFFGMSTNAFQMWNYQGGSIDFYTSPTPSTGTKRLTIETDGTLNVLGTANYEALVTLDDDIPNKKYVDDAIAVVADFIHVQPTTVQDVGGAVGTITAINWNTTPLHVDTATFTHSSVTNSSRIEVEATSRYEVKCNINTANTGVDRQVSEIYLRINGTTNVVRCTATDYSRGDIYDVKKSALLITEIDLTANDYIEVMHKNQDADLETHVVNTVVASCEFIMRRIG